MKDMSVSRQRAKDLVNLYSHSLEQQIVVQGSSLACRDEELWKQVEGPLRDGDGRDTHCLGLDPLRVMEESLTAAAVTTAASKGRARARGGLQGLERAFEVLEQAALNLYLCPWREEFKVVKVGLYHTVSYPCQQYKTLHDYSLHFYFSVLDVLRYVHPRHQTGAVHASD